MRIGKWKIKMAPNGWSLNCYRTMWPDGGNPDTGETYWITGVIALGPVWIVRVRS